MITSQPTYVYNKNYTYNAFTFFLYATQHINNAWTNFLIRECLLSREVVLTIHISFQCYLDVVEERSHSSIRFNFIYPQLKQKLIERQKHRRRKKITLTKKRRKKIIYFLLFIKENEATQIEF